MGGKRALLTVSISCLLSPCSYQCLFASFLLFGHSLCAPVRLVSLLSPYHPPPLLPPLPLPDGCTHSALRIRNAEDAKTLISRFEMTNHLCGSPLGVADIEIRFHQIQRESRWQITWIKTKTCWLIRWAARKVEKMAMRKCAATTRPLFGRPTKIPKKGAPLVGHSRGHVTSPSPIPSFCDVSSWSRTRLSIETKHGYRRVGTVRRVSWFHVCDVKVTWPDPDWRTRLRPPFWSSSGAGSHLHTQAVTWSINERLNRNLTVAPPSIRVTFFFLFFFFNLQGRGLGLNSNL